MHLGPGLDAAHVNVNSLPQLKFARSATGGAANSAFQSAPASQTEFRPIANLRMVFSKLDP